MEKPTEQEAIKAVKTLHDFCFDRPCSTCVFNNKKPNASNCCILADGNPASHIVKEVSYWEVVK